MSISLLYFTFDLFIYFLGGLVYTFYYMISNDRSLFIFFRYEHRHVKQKQSPSRASTTQHKGITNVAEWKWIIKIEYLNRRSKNANLISTLDFYCVNTLPNGQSLNQSVQTNSPNVRDRCVCFHQQDQFGTVHLLGAVRGVAYFLPVDSVMS